MIIYMEFYNNHELYSHIYTLSTTKEWTATYICLFSGDDFDSEIRISKNSQNHLKEMKKVNYTRNVYLVLMRSNVKKECYPIFYVPKHYTMISVVCSEIHNIYSYLTKEDDNVNASLTFCKSISRLKVDIYNCYWRCLWLNGAHCDNMASC